MQIPNKISKIKSILIIIINSLCAMTPTQNHMEIIIITPNLPDIVILNRLIPPLKVLKLIKPYFVVLPILQKLQRIISNIHQKQVS